MGGAEAARPAGRRRRAGLLLGGLALAASAAGAQAPSPTPARLTSARAQRVADSLLALMTLEEKLGQLTQFPGASGQTGPAVPPAADSAVRAGAIGSFLSIWSVRDTRRLQHGRIVPGVGWFDTDYLGIDQGPILAMLENQRTGLVWRLVRKNPDVVRGLCRAGFRGGWLDGRC